MNGWEMLDNIGERRIALRVAKLSAPTRVPTVLTPQLLIALILISLFAVAFLRESDRDTRQIMVGAMVAGFAGAWGYFLGSSNGASRNADRADTALGLAQDTVKLLPAPEQKVPDALLQPGQTAQAAETTESKKGEEA